MFVIFIPKGIYEGTTKSWDNKFDQHLARKPFDGKSKTFTLFLVKEDAPDPLFPLPPRASAVWFSFQVFLVAPDSSTCLRTVSSLFVGSRKFPNFSSKHERSSKTFKIFHAILPLFEGNMLYFLSVFVEEHLGLIYR